MERNIRFLILLMAIFVITQFSNAEIYSIKTYTDSNLTIESDKFEDGMSVFFVINSSYSGGTKIANVTNGKEVISMPIYDNGTYPDKNAGDGLYTGHFRVSTMMSIDIPQDPNRPKLVDVIYLKEVDTANITVENTTKGISLLVLFNINATTIKNGSAIIEWTTSIPSTGYIEYGLNTSYGNFAYTDNIPRLNHRIEVTSLSENTTYHYRIVTTDIYGINRTSEYKNFTTITSSELENLIRNSRSDNDLPKVYYVSTKGNDSNNGLTIGTAFRHISYAVSQSDVGDTIYVLDGRYEDEHISFQRGGIGVAPIRLLAYSGKPILDGIDLTGSAITIKDKEYIEISGFRIVNYSRGIYCRYTTAKNLYIHDFEMENIDNYAIDFDGTSLQKTRITNFVINNAPLNSGITITHFDYTSADTSDIEIGNFTITNSSGECINWRNTRRVHIHHGTFKNCGSDAIHLQLNVHGSVVNDVHIENTGWHGIAIHDHTVGYHPCYNNRIRSSYVYGAQHNDIDLHSGTFNTVVENCHLDGPPATGQGIYFHNLGAGLIARDNIIHDTGDGIDGGPLSGEFLTDIIIENNTIYNCTGISWQGSTKNIWIIKNRIFNATYWTPIHVGCCNITIIQNYIEGKAYRINSGYGRIIDNLDEIYYVKSGYGGNITAGYTNGRVFSISPISPPYITAPKWYPNGGYFTVFSNSSYPWPTPKVTTYTMTAVPASGNATITIHKFNTSLPQGEILVNFTTNTTDGNNIVFDVWGLKPYHYYLIKKDGANFITKLSNASGHIQFNNSEWSTKTFTIKETNGAIGTISGRVTDTTGAPIQGAVVSTNGYSDTTDASGNYSITLPVGNYTVTASKTGYQSQSKSAEVFENRTTEVNFTLTVATTTTSTTTSTTTTTSTSTTTTTTTSISTTSTTTTTTTTTSTTTSTTTTLGTTTTITTTTTIIWPCDLPGDYPPCGEVTLEEVVDFINLWVEGQAELGDVVNLINAWAEGPVCELPGDYPPCGEITLEEVVDFINLWAGGQADLGDVVNLINAWATG